MATRTRAFTMRCYRSGGLAFLCFGAIAQGLSVMDQPTIQTRRQRLLQQPLHATPNGGGGGYDDTDGISKGLVSSLTILVNRWMEPSASSSTLSENDIIAANPQIDDDRQDWSDDTALPTSPNEIMERIRADYVERNYLWTGDLDLACFTEDCRFQDPTIAFEGRDVFVRNVQNIRKVTDSILGPCRSELRDISLRHDQDNDFSNGSDGDSTTGSGLSSSYVETKWRMVGLFTGLPWQPCIDVPGRNKFWMKPTSTTSGTTTPNVDTKERRPWQVYRYEEEWEIPAAQALWQIVKPTNGEYPKQESSSLGS